MSHELFDKHPRQPISWPSRSYAQATWYGKEHVVRILGRSPDEPGDVRQVMKDKVPVQILSDSGVLIGETAIKSRKIKYLPHRRYPFASRS